MDFAIAQVNSILNMTDVQVQFFDEFKSQSENCVINAAHQKVFEMTFAEWDTECYKPKLMARCKTYFLCTLYKFM